MGVTQCQTSTLPAPLTHAAIVLQSLNSIYKMNEIQIACEGWRWRHRVEADHFWAPNEVERSQVARSKQYAPDFAEGAWACQHHQVLPHAARKRMT